MANELELLTINAAADSWVDLVPDAISTGYQAQNTNIEARSNGLESLYIEISGTDAIFNPSGVIDDNGAPIVVKSQVTLAVPSGQRFVRVIDGGSPTKRSLQLETTIGAYDDFKSGYYTSGDRMLNWSLNDISGSLKSYKILAPLNAHVLGDMIIDETFRAISEVIVGVQVSNGIDVLQAGSGLSVSGSIGMFKVFVNTNNMYLGQYNNADIVNFALRHDTLASTLLNCGVGRTVSITEGRTNTLAIFSALTVKLLKTVNVFSETTNSVNPALNVHRTVTFDENAHCFSDSSIMNLATGRAYNSYDARVSVNSSNDLDHYAAFQSIPLMGGFTGIIDKIYHHYGYASNLNVGGTINNEYGLFVNGTTGTGTVINHFGLYVNTPGLTPTNSYGVRILKSGATNEYGIFDESALNLFGVSTEDNLLSYMQLGNDSLGTTKSAKFSFQGRSGAAAPLTVDFLLKTDGFYNISTQAVADAISLNTVTGDISFVGRTNLTATPTASVINLSAGTPTALVPRGQYHIKLNSTGGSMSVTLQKFVAGGWSNIMSISGVTSGTSSLVSSSGTDLRLVAGGVISNSGQSLVKY